MAMAIFPKPELEAESFEDGYIFKDTEGNEAEVVVTPYGVAINTKGNDVFFDTNAFKQLVEMAKELCY